MCRMLGVSPSGYCAWYDREASAQAKANEVLKARIRVIHEASRETYGVPRVHFQLLAAGIGVGRKRVARLMREMDLAGVSRRKGTRTTH